MQGGGKGAGKGTKPVDDEERLSDGTREFHQELVNAVPQKYVDDGTWKDEIFDHVRLQGTDGTAFFEHVFDHLKDLGKSKNKRM